MTQEDELNINELSLVIHLVTQHMLKSGIQYGESPFHTTFIDKLAKMKQRALNERAEKGTTDD